MRPRIVFAVLIIVLSATVILPAEEAATVAPSGSTPPAWLYKLVEPLGVCTIVLLICTFTLGLIRRRLGRRFLKVHKTFAILTVISAICHGSLVLALY